MPQIAPFSVGSQTFGAPRIVKSGAVLFISPAPSYGAIGDAKVTIGELSFSSTRPRRTAEIRKETPLVVLDSATGKPTVVDNIVTTVTIQHGELASPADLEAERAAIVEMLAAGSYTTQVVYGRDGQY